MTSSLTYGNIFKQSIFMKNKRGNKACLFEIVLIIFIIQTKNQRVIVFNIQMPQPQPSSSQSPSGIHAQQKPFVSSSASSESNHDSEQQNYAPMIILELQPKIQQKLTSNNTETKNKQCKKQSAELQNKIVSNGDIGNNLDEKARRGRNNKGKDQKKQKNKKQNNINQNNNRAQTGTVNCNADIDFNIKRQQKKVSAAPPELITDSSKSSSSKSQKLQECEAAAPSNLSSRLYVGNLPLSISQPQLRKLFKKYGQLKEVQLAINSTTGKSKGFGFVEYFDIGHAIKAKQQISQHILDGLKINVVFWHHE